MARSGDLESWVREALAALGGEASVVDVARHIWRVHQMELHASGDLFFTWQHDMRVAAAKLCADGKLAEVDLIKGGYWRLA